MLFALMKEEYLIATHTTFNLSIFTEVENVPLKLFRLEAHNTAIVEVGAPYLTFFAVLSLVLLHRFCWH